MSLLVILSMEYKEQSTYTFPLEIEKIKQFNN